MVTIEDCTIGTLHRTPEDELRIADHQAAEMERIARRAEETALFTRRHADWARQQAAELRATMAPDLGGFLY